MAKERISAILDYGKCLTPPKLTCISSERVSLSLSLLDKLVCWKTINWDLTCWLLI